ncbi:MAG: alpha/beta hydrolase, partial [Caldilineaceae bacterium]|nr:alpha/beta hydrolase [Caldilineaceae bacterium]
ADMEAVITALKLERPVFLGQSWGGNVALHLAATRPGLLSGVGFIDGGFLSLQKSLGSDWKTVKERLSPPDFRGRQVEDLREAIQSNHPDWAPTGVQHTLGNFAVADDGTVSPNLSLDNHLRILHALWDMDPEGYYGCPAESSDDPERIEYRRQQVALAEEGLARSRTMWFKDTDHDIHVHRPQRLAEVLLEAVSSGLWGT